VDKLLPYPKAHHWPMRSRLSSTTASSKHQQTAPENNLQVRRWAGACADKINPVPLHPGQPQGTAVFRSDENPPAALTHPQVWLSLLTALEIVLGVDNLVVISIPVDRGSSSCCSSMDQLDRTLDAAPSPHPAQPMSSTMGGICTTVRSVAPESIMANTASSIFGTSCRTISIWSPNIATKGSQSKQPSCGTRSA
jgi:hypothetical protein